MSCNPNDLAKFNTEFNFHTTKVRPFEEDGHWYVELWGNISPSGDLSFSMDSRNQAFASYLASQMDTLEINRDGAPSVTVHFPKLSMDFSGVAALSEPPENIWVPSKYKFKLERHHLIGIVNDEYFDVKVINGNEGDNTND